MCEVWIKKEFLAFLENIVGGPSFIYRLSPHWKKMAAAYDISDRDYCGAAVTAKRKTAGDLAKLGGGFWCTKGIEPFDVCEVDGERSKVDGQCKDHPNLGNT